VALSVGLLASGCGISTAGARGTTTSTSQPLVTKRGGSLTLGIDQPVTGCNPNTVDGDTLANRLVLTAVLPSAFVIGPSGSPVLDQAVVQQAELVSTSPETIQYTINRRAEWSDGVPVTAADFIYAWQEQRLANSSDSDTSSVAATGGRHSTSGTSSTATSGTPATSASILGYRDIASVKGSDGGHVVTVVFKTPYSDWQSLFDYLVPAHVMDKVGWDPPCTSVDPAVDLSAGPFEVGSVSADQVALVRNPHWWGTQPYLDQVVVRTAGSEAELSHWLESGQVQVVDPSSFNPQFLETISSYPGARSSLGIGNVLLDLQFALQGSATKSRKVREAITRAINRSALVRQEVYWADKRIQPAKSHLFAQSQNHYPDLANSSSSPYPETSDLAVTDRLLASAGYVRRSKGVWHAGSGKDLVLRLVFDGGDQWARGAAGFITSELRHAGMAVLPFAAPDARSTGLDLSDGRADMAIIPQQTTPYSTQAIAWYTPLLGPPGVGGSQDWTGLDDQSLNSQLSQAAQELNPTSAQPYYQQVDAELWNKLADLPLFAEPTALAWSDRTVGIRPNPYPGGLLWYVQTWGLDVPASASGNSGTTAPHPTSTLRRSRQGSGTDTTG
jgi:peptide/nickel transport system substrate-binding protein